MSQEVYQQTTAEHATAAHAEKPSKVFENILVLLDGSKQSEYAAQFGFLFAEKMDAKLTAQHIVDPRIADLFIAPEFASELGLEASNNTTDKVLGGLHRIGALILSLFKKEAAKHSLEVQTIKDEGYVVFEALKRLSGYDLAIVGHHGRSEHTLKEKITIGSTAERLVTSSNTPVLIATSSPLDVDQVLVAFDGSEPSLGALLMAEQLAKALNKPLKATYITPAPETMAEARYAVANGEQYLKEKWTEPVFSIDIGSPADLLLEQADRSNSLLVIGAYGFRDRDQVVMGTTATHVIRCSKKSVLVYR